MIENTPLFGAAVHEVGVSAEGSTREAMRAQDIGRSKGNAVDFGALLGQAAQVSTAITNAEKIAETSQAKQDYFNIVSSEGYRNGDATVRAGMLEEMNATLHERSKEYADAYIGYSGASYMREYDNRAEIEDNSYYNAAPAAAKAWFQSDSGIVDVEGVVNLTQEQAGKTPADFVEAYATANPRLDKNVIRTSLMNDLYQEIYMEVGTATNEKELSEALLNVKDLKQPFMNDKFLTTKSKKGSELITAAERELNTLIKSKEAEFLSGHLSAIDSAADSGYSIHPAELEEHFNGAYKNEVKRGTQKRAYEKKYQETVEAHAFNTKYVLGDNPGVYPNDEAKKQRQFKVTDSLTELFSVGGAAEFVRIAHNEKGLTKETGTMILTQMNKSKSEEELNGMFTMLDKINSHPKGASVMRQMFTDDEYTRYMSTRYAMQYRPELGAQGARDWVDGLKRNITKTTMAPDKNSDMLNKASTLGSQSQAYLSVMNNLIATDVHMAEQLYKDVAKQFSNQITKTSTGKKKDISMGDIPETLDPERTDKYIDEALPEADSIIVVGDTIVGKNDLGATINVVNMKPIVDKSNSNTEDKLLREQRAEKESKGVGTAFKAFGRVLTDNAGRFVTGVPDVLGEVVSNIGSAIAGNAIGNLKQTIKNSPEFVQDSVGFVKKFVDIDIDAPNAEGAVNKAIDEMYLDELHNRKALLPTKMPEVQNNTLSPDLKTSLSYAIQKNQFEVKQIEKEIVKVEEDISIEEAKFEGFEVGLPLMDTIKEFDFTTQAQKKALESTIKKAEKQPLAIITDVTEMAQFRAQIQHESGGKSKPESGYYSTPERISKIFGEKRLQGQKPESLVKNTEKLLNVVYGGEWGKKNLGNTEEGDGYKYRGRGLIQITGRANYKKFGDMIGVDLVSNPDLALEPEIAEQVALAFWNTQVKPRVKDFSDTKRVTKIINGGYNGLSHRESIFKEYMR